MLSAHVTVVFFPHFGLNYLIAYMEDCEMQRCGSAGHPTRAGVRLPLSGPETASRLIGQKGMEPWAWIPGILVHGERE